MRTVYLCSGFLFFGLGAVGAFIPVLPTTPFLLLASYCFAKGSERYDRWFRSTKLYRNYLENFMKTKSLTLKRKLSIVIPVTIMLLCVCYLTPSAHIRYLIAILILVKYYYFFFRIKTD